jgi:uncharacterized protein
MRMAIIGSGISGLTAAYQLNKKYDITLYESDVRLGGHTATKTVKVNSGEYNIDTGFIVFNDWTYPNFIKLMDQLGVASQPTEMGFSAFYPDGRFEYSGTNFNTLFADRRTLFSVNHWRMLLDIVRFNKQAVTDWRDGKLDDSITLGQYLRRNGYSDAFMHRYLIPMGSAIWSSTGDDMALFPAKFFVQFFNNHGLLSVNNRPTWRVINGGSQAYVKPLVASYKDKIRLGDAVVSVVRDSAGVTLTSASGVCTYDQVIFACHSDQALKLLLDATESEKRILGAMSYRENDVTLHTDKRWLPTKKRTWSSWNYCLSEDSSSLPILTYNMNILQGIKSPETFCVTLNANDKIDSAQVMGRYRYAHPVFDQAAIDAQARWSEINGVHRAWFCGAYWRNGFHEDGVSSALRVSSALGVDDL